MGGIIIGKLGPIAAKPEILACLSDLLENPEAGVRWEVGETVALLGKAAATPEFLLSLSNALGHESLDFVKVPLKQSVNWVNWELPMRRY